ncbi:MAG TPA: LCP family protein [Syntrophomonadaceae bacterium]|nr:LCP family protein [Syntrophomonadaceae bacterium]
MMNFIKTNPKRIVFVILVFVLAFFCGAGLGKITGNGFKESILEQFSQGKVVNILLMGIDARSMTANSRSDTMILASVDTKNKKVVLVWIPRDTRVVPSTGHQEKINSVNLISGPEAACATVGQLLGTKVDYYIITNFWGFGKIIDTLGGVDIDVETNMIHSDPDPFLNINIPKGQQHLNGENALKYVRYRGGPTADIGRTQRQAKFVKAVAKEAFQTKTILKLPQLIPELMNSIRTNIPVSDLAYLATSAKDFENSEIITQTLPGYSFTDPKDGGSYWEADKTVANGIIASLLAGKTYDVIHDPPSWVSKAPVVTDDVEDDATTKGTPQAISGEKDGKQTGTTSTTGTTGQSTTTPTSPTNPTNGTNTTTPTNSSNTGKTGSGSGTTSGTNPPATKTPGSVDNGKTGTQGSGTPEDPFD